MRATFQAEAEREVLFLKVEAGVRYWEDATVNGVEDEAGDLIPFRDGDCWRPTIGLETGVIVDWPAGTEASIHYKVCDDGRYTLTGADFQPVARIDGYVPKIMCPGGAGYGDYIIMTVGSDGKIANWHPTLDDFEHHIEDDADPETGEVIEAEAATDELADPFADTAPEAAVDGGEEG